MKSLSKILPLLLLLSACSRPAPEPRGSDVQEPSATVAPGASVETLALAGVQPLHRVGDLYLAGQPGENAFRALHDAGVTRVLNLRHDAETPDLDEAAMLTGIGFEYVNVPWNGPQELTDDVIDRARAALASAEGPMLTYCASSNRVGAVWIPFRVLDQGVDLEQAVSEAREIGLRTPAYEDIARAYVSRHQ
jgi:uncharacterized protein (TIGR01244 family)